MSHRRLALVAVVVANLLWAGSYVAGKRALDEIPFVTLNTLRFGLATVILLPVLWGRRRRLPTDRNGLLRLAGIAGFGFCGNKALEFLGLSLTTATDTALLITSESLVTLLLAVLVLREPLHGRTAVALGIGALGVYVLVEGGLVAPRIPAGAEGQGDLLVVLSLMLESVATICGSALMRTHDAMVVTAAAVALSLVGWIPVEAVVVAHTGLPHLTAGAWVGVVYLAVATTVIGYGAWFWGMRHLSAQELTPLLLLQPVVGSLLAALLRAERPSPSTLLGGVLVVAAVALVALPGGVGPARRTVTLPPEVP